jgi:hypothetical protein
VYWICGSAANPPQGGTITICPQAKDGKVTGIIRPVNIVAAGTQGVSAGDFTKVIEAIGDGNSYVNIHTAQSPGGEARGQLRPGGGSNDGDGNGKGNSSGKGNSNGKGKSGD